MALPEVRRAGKPGARHRAVGWCSRCGLAGQGHSRWQRAADNRLLLTTIHPMRCHPCAPLKGTLAHGAAFVRAARAGC